MDFNVTHLLIKISWSILFTREDVLYVCICKVRHVWQEQYYCFMRCLKVLISLISFGNKFQIMGPCMIYIHKWFDSLLEYTDCLHFAMDMVTVLFKKYLSYRMHLVHLLFYMLHNTLPAYVYRIMLSDASHLRDRNICYYILGHISHEVSPFCVFP